MLSVKSNNIIHTLVEKGDVKVELISELKPLNINKSSVLIEDNYINVSNIDSNYDMLLLVLMFTESDFINKISGSELYPTSLFSGVENTTSATATPFMAASYIAVDSKVAGNALKYQVSLLKYSDTRLYCVCSHDDIKGNLYGIKL